jgi:2-dehydropantoate 2-reductase
MLAVLGVGGIGGVVAARTGGLCVGTERTVAALRERGLRLERAGEVTVVHSEAVEHLEHRVSLLVVAVKAYDLDAALDRVAPGALDDALVLPLLNGLEAPARLRTRFASGPYAGLGAPPAVAAGSIGSMSAYAPEPGVVVQGTPPPGRITVASRDLDRKRLAAVLAPLAVPGIDVVELADEAEVLWEKAARLAVLAAATVASGLAFGALRDDPAWRGRLEDALAEAVAVAAADGVRLSAPDQWAKIESMPAELTTSAGRDAAAGRPTELDAITGSVVRAGRRLGIPTPVLAELLEEARCRAR